ncbi:CoA-disulfide reductase [Evansella caseinilytica]|uniref:CoA-disulfide reductase n=1 Tax=Evansella caseinilytica TaxID=1503961 RepID=A0A1H3TGE3_9BACI|nr:CoA-disulfide reductase [Evansella caseinilytica]SDZ48735.1 CoA-disulfide reductase [Evansella caseinilytica]
MTKKVIIVGGVAGGATAAGRLRRLDEKSHIIMFERGEHVSFANCGLPYYIGGAISKREKLLVQTVEAMSKKYRLDIRNLSEVVKINRDAKTVLVKNIKTGEQYEESYDDLLLSPGAKPVVPPIAGIAEAEQLFTLRNIPDTDRIKAFITEKQPKSAVVIGGGFIGVEMAENLKELGLDVTLVEMANQVLAPLDYEMAAIIRQKLSHHGIKVILEDGVQELQENGRQIILKSGGKLAADMIVLSIGVKPENKLAEDSGLTIGERGGIVVNQYLQTSDPSIYAVGDAIEVTDCVSGKPALIPLAGPANRQARIAADNISGRKKTYAGTLGTAVVKIFDYTAASTGNNEKTLRRYGMDYRTVHLHPGSHAGYYPGATPIHLKLLFTPDEGKILGAQAIGKSGVEKRIDVIATAMKGGLTVFDLTNLELSYAPPYSSAKDPVNMAGYVAANIIEDGIKTIQWHEVDEVIQSGGLMLDVREPHEQQGGMIENTRNIPLGQLRERLDELPKSEPIYIHCQVGLRGYLAVRILLDNGFDAVNVDGGWVTYSLATSAQLIK